MEFRPRVLYFVIFDRSGKQLFYRAWGPDARTDPAQIDEHAKLVYGVVFSLKQMIPSLSSDSEARLKSLTTSAFTLHVFESGTGYRFVLGTFVANAKQQGTLKLFVTLKMINVGIPCAPCVQRTPRRFWKTYT